MPSNQDPSFNILQFGFFCGSFRSSFIHFVDENIAFSIANLFPSSNCLFFSVQMLVAALIFILTFFSPFLDHRLSLSSSDSRFFISFSFQPVMGVCECICERMIRYVSMVPVRLNAILSFLSNEKKINFIYLPIKWWLSFVFEYVQLCRTK